jgi:hypothetical protein
VINCKILYCSGLLKTSHVGSSSTCAIINNNVGARHAINMDGGGSPSIMVYEERVVIGSYSGPPCLDILPVVVCQRPVATVRDAYVSVLPSSSSSSSHGNKRNGTEQRAE